MDARFVAGVASCITDSRCTKIVSKVRTVCCRKITHGSCSGDLREGVSAHTALTSRGVRQNHVGLN